MTRAHTELAGPAYSTLWASLRRRLEGNGVVLSGYVTVASSDPEQRRAAQALLGSGSSRVELAAIDRAIRDAVGCGLIEWLERIGPPLRDRVAERHAKAQRRAVVESLATAHDIATRPWFDEWLAVVNRGGAMAAAARLEDRNYLEAALAVLSSVLHTLTDGVPLATLVADATGDTKRMASATVRAMVEQALALESGTARPMNSTQRRDLWRRFGVIIDDVSSDVLVLNLRPPGDTRLVAWLADAAEAGEPFRITLRQLTSMPLSWDRATAPTVSVCENPAIVMDAANRLGANSSPLVCTEGVPSDAFWALATGIAHWGVALRVHADFDAAGCSIVGSVIARCGATAWRYDEQSYVTGLQRWGERMTLPLSKGTVPDTPWDARLGATLRVQGRALYEELVVDDLIDDLRT